MGKNMKTSSATKMAPTALKGFDLFDLLLQINGKQHCNIARIQHVCDKSKKNYNCYQSYIGMYSKVNVVKFTLTEMWNCEQWHNVPHMHLITMAQCGRCPLHM